MNSLSEAFQTFGEEKKWGLLLPGTPKSSFVGVPGPDNRHGYPNFRHSARKKSGGFCCQAPPGPRLILG